MTIFVEAAAHLCYAIHFLVVYILRIRNFDWTGKGKGWIWLLGSSLFRPHRDDQPERKRKGKTQLNWIALEQETVR